MKHVLALDSGTTSCRAVVYADDGSVRAVAQREIEQHYPHPGWVEHDADEIWAAQVGVATEALSRAHVRPRDIAALGITNQRETTVVWNRATGRPVHRAIVWQDRRTAGRCDQLRADGVEKVVQDRTGLVLDSYFSATKIAWILDHVPGARRRAEAGELAFGTIDSWLAWKLSDGAVHITDATNASRTMLFNIRTGQWDDELLGLFGVPRALLPEVRGSSEVYAPVAVLGGPGVPIAGIAGDQQAALFGQLCTEPGQTKTTYGTGCFALQHTGEHVKVSENRMLATVALRAADRTTYALEGSIFMGGATVQWLRDGLGIIRSSDEVEGLAASVPDSGGVCMVPAFTGLGAPHWDAAARGLIIGLTRGTTRAHIARAALEGIAHQVADVLEAMQADSGLALPEMRVDGAACRNDLLMQLQADLLGVKLVRPEDVETTARGAAYLAGLAAGVWTDRTALEALRRGEKVFEPRMNAAEVRSLRGRWSDALTRAKGWEKGASQ
jgi:glycerol kinase